MSCLGGEHVVLEAEAQRLRRSDHIRAQAQSQVIQRGVDIPRLGCREVTAAAQIERAGQLQVFWKLEPLCCHQGSSPAHLAGKVCGCDLGCVHGEAQRCGPSAGWNRRQRWDLPGWS